MAIFKASSLPPNFPPSFPLFTQCDRCLLSLLSGGSWLACQDLPAKGAVSMWKLLEITGTQPPFCDAVVNGAIAIIF